MSDVFDHYSINRKIAKDTFIQIVNQLPVSLLDFALISGMRERAYGVRTFGQSSYGDEVGNFNQVARNSIWRHLFGVQQYVMTRKRIALGELYIAERRLIDPLTKVFHANLAPIEDTNVTLSYTSVDTETISPYIVENVTLQLNGDIVEAVFSKTLVENPYRVMPRDSETLEQFPWRNDLSGYPATSGSNWVMPCNTEVSSDYVSDPDKQINLQHYDYMILEIDPVASTSIDNIVIMHPNTKQAIPFAKEPEIVSGPKWRFWFYAWTMGKPAFSMSQIDLVEGEFYKIYDTVSVYKKVETHTAGTVYIQDDEYLDDNPNADESGTILVQSMDYGTGSLKWREVTVTDEETDPPTYGYVTSGLPLGKRYSLLYYYKTNPFTQQGLFDNSIELIRDAICGKVAAALANRDDGNNPVIGNDYIREMQREYTKNVPFFMSEQFVVNYQYGNRHGDKLFSEALQNIRLRGKGIVL